jgi:chromosome segregation ATPase
MDLELLETLAEVKRARMRVESSIAEGQEKIWAPCKKLAGLLIRVENVIERQHREKQLLETDMGRAADAINQLNSQLSATQSNLSATQDSLLTAQSQLSVAQANAYDAADVAAINGVLNLAGSNASSGATNISGSTSNVSGGASNTGGGGSPVSPGSASNGSSGANS